uniref:Uncharacterized protein n=1 Tax=Mycobacterium riyadhense TaxID=486698 RepID=A0A653EI95_9MYCO|nr:hypothetical protein BIN_B_01898 [Mycobacterium riyadhense]
MRFSARHETATVDTTVRHSVTVDPSPQLAVEEDAQ